MRTAAAQPHPRAQWRRFLLPASAAASLQPGSGPWRGGGCGVGCRKGIFSSGLPLASAGGERGGVDTAGSALNGTGDAARRGPGCAALQLNRRRRPGAPRPRPSSLPLPPPRPPPALSAVPTLPGLGVSRLGAPSSPAPALQLLPPSLQQVCTSAGTLRACLWGGGWKPLSSSFLTPRSWPSFCGGSLSFVFVVGRMPSACHQMGRGGVVGISAQTVSIFPIESQTR